MNSSKEFLEQLAEELRYLPSKQVNEVLKHYRDKINVEIDYGTPIEKVLESMKSPAEIAKGIYEMHGVNYLAKRKKQTKVKDVINAGICAVISCLIFFLFFGIAYFFESVVINQISLIGNAFTFKSILDIVLTTLCVLSYILIMFVIFIFIADLFIILLNGLLGKILDAKESTRGKNYSFMDFTFTGWFNDKTKKPKFLFKVLIGLVIAFIITGVSSYATNGYINRTIRNVTSKSEIVEIDDKFESIFINSNEVNLTIIEDANVTKPTITYEYEFNKYHYDITNNILNISVDKNKTYDFLGIIQAPSSKLKLNIPLGYSLDKIDIKVNYGDIYLKGLTNSDNFTINVLNGNVILGDNKNIDNATISLSVGNIVSNKNNYNNLNITHASGELNSGEDTITKLNHHNGSSSIKTVGSKIEEYNLSNSSGTVYLENLSGNTITISTNSSINTLYDINYRIGDFKINNTCKLNITRSYFSEKIVTLSNTNSYQTLNYVKSPLMDISGLNGTIICTNINTNYSSDKISSYEDEYRDRAYSYNKIKLDNCKIEIKSYEANISIDELVADELYFEQTRQLSIIDNVNVKSSKMIFLSALSNISEFYGETIDMKADSRSITDKTSIDFVNSKESELVVNIEKDGTSEFNASNNITIKEK